MIERLKRCKFVDNIVIATTTDKTDDVIIDFAKENKLDYFRGSRDDVLDRTYKAAKQFEATIVVRIPSDGVLIDPCIVDTIIKKFILNGSDYTSNAHPYSYPDGYDVEVINIEALETAWKNAKEPHEREHVTPYIWENPDKFKLDNVRYWRNLFFKNRWGLDYKEDFQLIKKVYEALYPKNPHFTMDDILNFLDKHPKIRGLNKQHLGHMWYNNHIDKLKTIEKRFKK